MADVMEIVALQHCAPCLRWCLRVADLRDDNPDERPILRPLFCVPQGRCSVLKYSNPFEAHRGATAGNPPPPRGGANRDISSADRGYVEEFYRYLQLGQPYEWSTSDYYGFFEVDFRNEDSWASQEMLRRMAQICEWCRGNGVINHSWRILLDREDEFAFFDIRDRVSFLYYRGIAIRAERPYRRLECFYSIRDTRAARHVREEHQIKRTRIVRTFQLFLQPRLLVRSMHTETPPRVFWYFCLLEVRDLAGSIAMLSSDLHRVTGREAVVMREEDSLQ